MARNPRRAGRRRRPLRAAQRATSQVDAEALQGLSPFQWTVQQAGLILALASLVSHAVVTLCLGVAPVFLGVPVSLVGFPALASTSMQQGRHAACHAFGLACDLSTHLLPYGIFTIPEISMVGRNEDELTRDGVPYEIGVARYREIARGQLIGDTVGMLKLLFHTETRALLGVHVIGEGATELVHIGQAVIAHGGKLDYFIDTVFNYPTLAECYKVAALAALNKFSNSSTVCAVE